MNFTLIVILVQIVIVIFLGGFSRSLVQIQSYDYLTTNQLLLFSIVILYSPFKKLALHSIVLVLLISAFVFQCQILFGVFWEFVFEGFSNNFNLASKIMIQATFAQLAISLIVMDFIGIFRYWQIFFFIGIISTFGYALNAAILLYALDIFDIGGGLRVFAFSGMTTIILWALSVRAKTNVNWHQVEEHYPGQTVSLFGLIGCFITWPIFNQSGGFLTSFNTNLGDTSQIMLENCGYFNSIIGLSIGLGLSFMFVETDGTSESKLKIRYYIDCFLNCGMAIASSVSLSFNPAPSMIIAFLCSIITLIFFKYIKSTNTKRQTQQSNLKLVLIVLERYSRAFFRVLMPFLGIIVSSIVISTRSNSTPSLLNTQLTNYPLTAGLQIVGFLVTLAIAAVFGAISGVVVNFFMKYKEPEEQEESNEERAANIVRIKKQNLTDFDFFSDLLVTGCQVDGIMRDQQQLFPLYLQKQDIYIDEHTTARKLIRESMLSHIKNNETQKPRPTASSNPDLNNYKTKAICSRIIKNEDSSRKSVLRHQKSQLQLNRSMMQRPKARIMSQQISKSALHEQQIRRQGLLASSEKPIIGKVKSQSVLKQQQSPKVRRKISYGNISHHSSQIQDENKKP